MPIYEYECKDHGVFDVFHKMDDESSHVCERCGKKMTKKISAPAVQIKVGGIGG